MNVALHLSRPFQKSPEIAALPPGKFPKLQKADLLHFHPAVGLNPPKKERAAPGSEAVSAGSIPKKSKNVGHCCIITSDVGRQSSGFSLQASGFRRQASGFRRQASVLKNPAGGDGNCCSSP